MATYRKRGGRWHVQVRRKGHAALTQSFTLKADAEVWAREREVEIERNDWLPRRDCLRTVTLGDLLTRYQSHISAVKKGSGPEGYRIRSLKRHALANLTLHKLTTARIAEYRDERLRKVKPPSVRRELFILRHCLELARKEWGIGFVVNPMVDLRLPASAPHRERRLSPVELEKLSIGLRKSRNRLLASAINLAILTGMRRSELLGLTWRNVDLDRSLAFLPDTKNGRPRHVPLSPCAREVLDRLNRGKPDDRVLPISPNAVRLAWERLKARAGIKDLRFHDLRHEAISRFFEAGLSVPEVSFISGHRDPRMLLKYTHLRAEMVVRKLAKEGTGDAGIFA